MKRRSLFYLNILHQLWYECVDFLCYICHHNVGSWQMSDHHFGSLLNTLVNICNQVLLLLFARTVYILYFSHAMIPLLIFVGNEACARACV